MEGLIKMNRRVLVTGGNKGIGRAISIYLSEQDFEVIVNYKSDDVSARETLETIKSNDNSASLLKFDVSNRDECADILTNDMRKKGAYYGVVLNAGVKADRPFPDMDSSHWDTVINTDLNSFYNVIRPVVMPMIRLKTGGRIVTITSISALTGNRGQVNYSAAKAGLVGATKSLALELAKRKITVNSVAPGIIETEMSQDIDPEFTKNVVPMRRPGKPHEVASLVRYLFSEESSYITGEVISVNGGMFS